MDTDVTEAPPESHGTVQEGLNLIRAWDEGGAPSQSWPSTAQMMHEIQTATSEKHGGPLETPTLSEVRPATWNEIRERIQAEKDAETAAAAAPAPVAPPAPEEPAAAVSGPGETPAVPTRQDLQNARRTAKRIAK